MKYLGDSTTTELVYGGGAGGGKSVLGCANDILCSYAYPGSRGVIARKELKSLKESTLLTYFQVAKMMGLKVGYDVHYSEQSGVLQFPQTGSVTYLRELDWVPSDPDYERLGSTEYTRAFIDEAGQIKEKGKNALNTRIRYRLDDFGLVPKLLMTCNPSKDFLYRDYYKPWKDKDLPEYRAFVQSLVGDNPFLPKSYIENLHRQDPATRERLLYGNWEYDDDPTKMLDFDAIADMFSNAGIADGTKCIVGDLASSGTDRIVLGYWNGWKLEDLQFGVGWRLLTGDRTGNQYLPSTEERIEAWREKYQVSRSNVVLDAGGLGIGLVQRLSGVKGYLGGASPVKKKGENYSNLRSQCSYYLARKINAREILIATDDPEARKGIVQEVEQLKTWEADKDGKTKVIPKEKISEAIGRSPDFLDMLTMRCYLDLLPKPRFTVV